MTLLYYESLLSGLNLHTAGGPASPHKVAMLFSLGLSLPRTGVGSGSRP